MSREEITASLANAREILSAIRANTESQGRIITKRQMTGLGRLLREREALLDRLAVENEKISRAPREWLPAERQALAEEGRQTLALCAEVIRQAAVERTNIAAELRCCRISRQARNEYQARYRPKSGNRLNIKG